MKSYEEIIYLIERMSAEYYKYSLLKLNRQELTRKKIVFCASIFFSLVFMSFAIMQSGALFSKGCSLTAFSNFMDVFAMVLCCTFFIAGLFNVLYIEKERARLEKAHKIKVDKEYKYKNKKFVDFCNKYGNTVDLIGTTFTTVMQVIVVIGLTLTFFDLSSIPSGTAFNLQGIIDTTGNIIFTIAAAMFLIAYLVKCKNDKSDKKSNTKLFILSSLFFGLLLVCGGKILFSFEARGLSYGGGLGPFGITALPLGLIMRTVGMIIFCVGYAVLLVDDIKKNKELEEECVKDYYTRFSDKKLRQSGCLSNEDKCSGEQYCILDNEDKYSEQHCILDDVTIDNSYTEALVKRF